MERDALLASGELLAGDICGNVAAGRMADAAAKRRTLPVDMHLEADRRRDLTVATKQHLVRSWLLWCDPTREARADLQFLGSPTVLSRDEFADDFSDAQGQFVDDWADPLGEEDPFAHLQSCFDECDDLMDNDFLGKST